MTQKETYSPETQRPEIIKDDNWSPLYLNQYGNETKTFRNRLEDFMMTPLKQMESLVNMISDDDYGNFGFVCEALIAANIMKIQKACELIEEAMGGKLFVDTPLRTDLTYDGGTPIGVLCKPEQEEPASVFSAARLAKKPMENLLKEMASVKNDENLDISRIHDGLLPVTGVIQCLSLALEGINSKISAHARA